jgi:hypothetical protein
MHCIGAGIRELRPELERCGQRRRRDDFCELRNGGESEVCGDVNGDGVVTAADAVIALEIAAGGSASCDPETFTAADVSGDGCVTSLDALMILQVAAGAIEIC